MHIPTVSTRCAPARAHVARTFVTLAIAAVLGACAQVGEGSGVLQLRTLGAYTTGLAGSIEIVAFDAPRAHLFVTNANEARVDVLDLEDPSAPTWLAQLDLSAYGGAPTSVDVSAETVAIALPANNPQDPGSVVFYRATDLSYINRVQVGALPDMLMFSPDGSMLVVACEGEPSPDYRVDPPGEVSIIDLHEGIAELDDDDVRHADFAKFADFEGPLSPRLELAGRAKLTTDLEPEFVAISSDSTLAWVSLQESNAVARVELATAEVTQLIALGTAVHPHLSALDPPSSSPVLAMRQPDALATFAANGRDYLITANEGECRSYATLDETQQLRRLRLDPVAFPDAARLQHPEALGRIVVSDLMGDLDGDGDYDEIHACGSRSVSVFTSEGELVWDSGAFLDQLTRTPAAAKCSGADRGPSPEGVVTAQLGGIPYAFVGLERAGGIVMFDLSTPTAPVFVTYEPSPEDAGPEGLAFVSAEDSPNGEPLLIVANEISGSVRIFAVTGTGITPR